MNPKDYKNKTVIHTPTQKQFVVIGGGKTKKTQDWYLKDAQGNTYLLADCQLVESKPLEINRLEFDLRKIKAVKNLDGLTKLYQMIGQERFSTAWEELEKDSVEAAAVGILYCSNWDEFCKLMLTYEEVSKEVSPELNKTFRDRIREKGLENLIATWYSQREEVA
jgi:hypothetical protein